MPQDPGKPSKVKSKSKSISRVLSQGDVDLPYSKVVDDADAVLPLLHRKRLHHLFSQIEQEFELIYTENLSLKERLEVLTEQLETAAAEKVLASELVSSSVVESGGGVAEISKIKGKRESLTASQLSQKLKNTYKLKASTSKIVSTFKAPATVLSCHLVSGYVGHRDGVWDVATMRLPDMPPLLATASADHTARIWDIPSGNCVLQYYGHQGSVNSVRFHPNQDLVISASGDQTAHVWRATGGEQKSHSSEEEVEYSEKEDIVNTGDESEFVCGGGTPRSIVKTPLQELTGHTGVVIAADWIVGGDQVITGSWDRTANVYDLATGDLVIQLVGHDQELTHVSTHPFQKLVVSSSKDTTFRLWDFREAIHSVSVFQGHTDTVTSATFTSGDKVVSGSDDRSVKVWDLKNMRSPLTTIRLDSSVNKLAISTQHVLAIPQDNRHVYLYDLNGVRLARLPRSNRQGHRRMVCSVAWADDPSCNLFTCGFDRLVLGWQLTGAPIQKSS